MKALVTGACGFIGVNLCESLLKDGYSVTGVDAFTENYSRDLKQKNFMALDRYANFNLVESDLLKANLAELMNGKDVVFHLAGQPSVQNSWGDDFQLYSERNIVLTHKLLCAAKEANIDRFVNSSSSSVYGRVLNTPTKEEDDKHPVSPYGVTKLAAENLVSVFGSEFGMNTVSLRYFTVFGPRQRPDMAFNKLIASVIENGFFSLHGDGSQVRDFTYVDDIVNANKLAAFSEFNPGSIFNIGGGSPVSMQEIIKMIEEIMSVRIKVKLSPLGPGNPLLTMADFSKAASTLGWKPSVDIYEGLEAQVAWQLAQM